MCFYIGTVVADWQICGCCLDYLLAEFPTVLDNVLWNSTGLELNVYCGILLNSRNFFRLLLWITTGLLLTDTSGRLNFTNRYEHGLLHKDFYCLSFV